MWSLSKENWDHDSTPKATETRTGLLRHIHKGKDEGGCLNPKPDCDGSKNHNKPIEAQNRIPTEEPETETGTTGPWRKAGGLMDDAKRPYRGNLQDPPERPKTANHTEAQGA